MATTYPISNGSIVEIMIRGTLYGETILTVLHWRADITGGPTSDGLALLNSILANLDTVATGLTAKLANCTSEDFVINELSGQWIYPDRFARVVVPPEAAAGLIEGPAAPSNIALVVQKRSIMAGRKGIGSIHLAAQPADALASNRWAAEQVTLATAFADKCKAAPSIDIQTELTPIIYNRTTPFSSVEWSNTTVSNEPRTMRRRGVRQGI